MDSAATQLFGGSGLPQASSANGYGGGGAGGVIAAPINAVGRIAGASTHLTLLGVVLFLVFLWALVRVAGFRFVIATGVGR